MEDSNDELNFYKYDNDVLWEDSYMKKVCPKCNKLNPDSARFCENCGEELAEVSKTPSKSGGTGGWWSRQGSGAKAGVIIAGLCCIGLIVIIGLVGLYFPDATSLMTSQSDSPYSSSNSLKTYSGHGIYFQYPSEWSEYTSDAADSDRIVSLETDKGDSSLLAVFAESDEGKDLEYWKDIDLGAASNMGTVTSQKKIKIAGVTGYRIDSSTEYSYQSSITFVKNGKTYNLLFTTGSLNAIDGDINTIVSSFKTI